MQSAARQSRSPVAAVEPDGTAVRDLLVQVAHGLQRRSGALNRTMIAAIAESIGELDDTELGNLLHASIDGNIATIIHMLRNDIPLEHAQVPTTASEYAVRLARAGVPVNSLRRAYHLGSDDLLTHMFTEIQAMNAPSELQWRLVHHLTGWLHRYVDWVTRAVIEVYEAERIACLTQNASDVFQLVQRVVDREPVGVEHFDHVTGYRLDQTHVAVVLWVEGGSQGVDRIDTLRALVPTLIETLGSTGAHLFTPTDRATAWVWLAGPHRQASTYAQRLRTLLAATPSIRVALGSPEHHVSGFRRSLEQANAIRVVASADPNARNQVVSHSDDGIAVVAMLARDLPATRRWLHEVLGELAIDSPAAARTRETVRVFLRTGSYTDTSERLMLHRNTVKYRITKVEKERGRPLMDGRLDLEMALHVCDVLGTPVLVRAPA